MSESRYVSLRDLLKDQPCQKPRFLDSSTSQRKGESSKTLEKSGVTEMFDELNLTEGSSSKLSPLFVPSSLYVSDSSPENEKIVKFADSSSHDKRKKKSKKNRLSANEGYEEKNAAFTHEEIKILPKGVMYVLRQDGRLKLNIAYDAPEGVEEEEEEEEEVEEEEEEVEVMAVAVAAAEKEVESGEEL